MERRVNDEVMLFALAGAIAGAVLAGRRATVARRLGGVALGMVAGAAIGLAGTRFTGRRSVPPHGPVTQALVSVTPADTVIGPPGANMEQRLDEAIQETYPASDPIAVHIE